ncbi:MAG: transcription elongation factor GreA [Planctomycetia bacterium]|jgi:transcription elongation factor GreA
MSDRIPMTRAGYDKLRAELDHLENEEMPKIEKRIGEARAEGDLSENAESHGARESQGMLQAKINVLRDKLNRASILDPSQIKNKDEIAFGATVVLRDLDLDDEETYTFVGAGEEDYDTGKILTTSPFAQGLMGKKKGDKVEIEVPNGTLKYEILDVTYEG